METNKEKGKLWTNYGARLGNLRVGWRKMYVKCKCAEVGGQENVTKIESFSLRP